MIAWFIRFGTAIFGDSNLGVRFGGIVAMLVTQVLLADIVWRVTRDVRAVVLALLMPEAALYYGLLMAKVAPDTAMIPFAMAMLWSLVRLDQSKDGRWWLAAGLFAGLALLSKFTVIMLAPAVLAFLLMPDVRRRWIASRYPWLAALIALAVFSPVILWNADHHWVSFIKQIGRARIEDFKPAFIGELIPTQIAFATPLIFILGAMGLYALLKRNAGALAARLLITTNLWTIVAYFIWHSLHARVEANWFAPVYPAFAIAAAVAANLTRWDVRQQRVVDFCLRWAAPTGILMFALLIVQANTGFLSGYRRDATVRSVGVGWRELASEIEAVRTRVGAGCVLAPDYGTTGWLAFYLPKGTCVAQQNQRIRWVNMPEPDPAQLSGKLLYVDELRPGGQPFLRDLFARVERVAELKRKRGPLTIETYALDLLEVANGSVLDRSPPPELE